MEPKKRILFITAVVFTLVMLYLGYDLMRRTTRPGAKKHLPTEVGA